MVSQETQLTKGKLLFISEFLNSQIRNKYNKLWEVQYP